MPIKLLPFLLFLSISYSSFGQSDSYQINDNYLEKVMANVLEYRKKDSLKFNNNPNLDSTISKGDHYYNIGQKHWNYDRLDSSIHYRSLAAEAYQKEGDYENQAKTLRDIGWVHTTQFNYSMAMDVLLKAQNIYQQHGGDSSQIARFHKGMGNLYNFQGDYVKSRIYYEKAYNFFKQHGCSEGLATCYNLLAIQSYDEDNFEAEYNLTEKAFSCIKTLEKNDVYIRLALNMGNIYSRHQEYAKAVKHYELALKAIEISRSKNLKNISLILLHYGWLEKQNKNYKAALCYFNKAEKWIQKSTKKKELFLCRVYKYSAEIQDSLGNHELALSNLKKYHENRDVVENTEAALKMANIDNEYKLKLEKAEKESLQSTSYLLKVIIGLLLIVISGIGLSFFFRRKLNFAQADLVKRNIEITQLETVSNTNQASISNQEEQQKKYASSALEEDKKNELLNQLIQLMEKEKPYLKAETSIGSLADKLGSNRRYLSQIVNEKLQKNFSTFLNQYRIQEARLKMADKAYEHYTIEAISKETGFNSISAFNTAFVKYTGVSPSVFLKGLKQNKNV